MQCRVQRGTTGYQNSGAASVGAACAACEATPRNGYTWMCKHKEIDMRKYLRLILPLRLLLLFFSSPSAKLSDYDTSTVLIMPLHPNEKTS